MHCLNQRPGIQEGKENSMKTLSKVSLIAAITLLSAMLPVAAVSAARPASAGVASMTFSWHIGDDFLASVDPSFGVPSIATASLNGDMIAVKGTGTLSVHDMSVSGGGTFVHMDQSGNQKASGTWEATKLLSFVTYGDGSAQGLPSTLFGGMAKMQVNLLVGGNVVHTGILTIFCGLGNHVPHHVVSDGITLNVQDAINFNKQVSGATVFVVS